MRSVGLQQEDAMGAAIYPELFMRATKAKILSKKWS